MRSITLSAELLTNATFLSAFEEKFKISVDYGVRSSSTRAQDYLSSLPLLSTPKQGEVLYLYLAVSNHAVSPVLIREEDEQQKSTYYTSKILLDVETRYLPLKKLALALVNASHKLSHYFCTL